MKKKIITVLTAVLALAMPLTALTSCKKFSDSWEPAGMQLASGEDVDYKLWVPDDWTVDISTGVTSAYVSDSDRSNICFTAFSLSGSENSMTVSEYWNSYKEDLAATFPDMEIVDISEEDDSAALAGEKEDGVSLIVNDVAAKKYVYTATVTGTQYKFMQVIFIRAGYAYILTYTALPDNYDTNLSDVEDIIEDFRFRD